jgi:hypothetical protein
MGSFTSGLSGLATMRDSFSSRVTSSIKDQWHTLVEEEEDEPPAPSSPPQASRPRLLLYLPWFAIVLLVSTSVHFCSAQIGLSLLLLATSHSGISIHPHEAPWLEVAHSYNFSQLDFLFSAPDGVLSKATALHRRSVVVPPAHASTASMSFFRRASVSHQGV